MSINIANTLNDIYVKISIFKQEERCLRRKAVPFSQVLQHFVSGSVILFLLIAGTTAVPQTAVPLPSAPRANRFSGTLLQPGTTHTPLGDFVPCLFNPDELIEMHSLRQPPQPGDTKPQTIDLATAQDLVDKTLAEFTKLARSASAQSFYNSDNYLNDLTQSYKSQVKAEQLKGTTPREAVARIRSVTEGLIQELNNQLGTKYRRDPNAVADPAAVTAVANQMFEQADAAVKTAGADLTNKPVQAYEPPDDVSCSMSVMTWKEASDVFGRRVANTYVAIQVTVRNLNSKNEFLIHDMQVAVDTGIDSTRFSRFQAGRDKLLVRAVAQRGQSEDRRNLALNALQAVGAIAGSSSIAATGIAFKSAVAVFQGAFIPGYTTLFPDHTVEQINHINDLVFSASSTSKVLVPVQGSVPLVTFISEKPIEQMPFAWCGHTSKTEFCKSLDIGDAPGRTEVYPADKSHPDEPWQSLQYRDWKAAALSILQERTFVVIGGVHIQQLTKSPAVANLDCPVLMTGELDISQLKDGMVTCTATGTDLDAVSSVSLQKGSSTVAGKIIPAKDGNSAEVQFKPADLSDLEGLYGLFFVDKTGASTNAKDSVTLKKQPAISGVGSSQLASTAAGTLGLLGKHLDLVTEFDLIPDSFSGTPIKNSAIAKAPSAGDASVTVPFPALPRTGTYHLGYTTSSGKNMIEMKSLTVVVTN